MVTPAQIIQAFGAALNQALDIIQELLVADAKDKTAVADGLAKIEALNAQLKTATTQLASTQMNDADLTAALSGFTTKLATLATQAHAVSGVTGTTTTTTTAKIGI